MKSLRAGILGLTLVSNLSLAADWPMYRGNPGRTGSMPGAGPKTAPGVVWSATLDGSSYRSPIVVGDTAYVGTASGTIPPFDPQLLAMKAGNGLGVLPCILADSDEQLTRIKPEFCRQEEAIWLVVHEAVRGIQRIRLVCDFLATIVKQSQSALLGMTA